MRDGTRWVQHSAYGLKTPFTERLRTRQQHSVPVIDAFKGWLDKISSQVLPQSALGKAVHYARGQWGKLSVFLSNASVPIDNNVAENSIRPFVLGRKAWLFCDTKAGAVASANLYSLVVTAKANGVEPHAYLTHIYTHLPSASTVEDFEELLPWSYKVGLGHECEKSRT